ATGVILGLIVFYDVFKSIVLPRPSINKFVFVRALFFTSWSLWRWIGDRIDDQGRREGWLATFAPVAALLMFLVWGGAIMLAYSLIFDGLRDEMRPVPSDFLESVYFSATTIVALSYGGFVPEGFLARIFTVGESATGVTSAALVRAEPRDRRQPRPPRQARDDVRRVARVDGCRPRKPPRLSAPLLLRLEPRQRGVAQ